MGASTEAAGLVLPSVAERMMFQDLIGYLPDDILVKVDRASMAVSLEARAPLLDHRLVEFTWRLPLSFRIRDGRGKWLLRRIVDRHVPRGAGRAAEDRLRRADRRLAARSAARVGRAAARAGRARAGAGFDARVVTAAWQRHLAGQAEELRLWPVLMFQAWREHWG